MGQFAKVLNYPFKTTTTTTSAPHLGLAQLPVRAVVVLQQLDAAPPGVVWRQHTPHQHLVPEEEDGELDVSAETGLVVVAVCYGIVGRDEPGAEVLERSPDREAGASDLHRLQHAGVSELVQNHGLVELVRHLEAEGVRRSD